MDEQLNNSPRILTLTVCFVACLLAMPHQGWSQSEAEYRAQFDSANAAYARGDFSDAQKAYEIILNDRVHFEAEFNLGNALFKQQKFGEAILHYERARQLTPGNEDLETNLTLANSQISDRIESLPTAGISRLWEGIVAPGRQVLWQRLMIVCWTLGFIALALRILSVDFGNRRIWGTSGASFVAIGVAFMALSWTSLNRISNEKSAVVLANESSVRSQPGSTGMTLFMLHEGTKIAILKQEGEYTKIQLPNGNVGWIQTMDIEVI